MRIRMTVVVDVDPVLWSINEDVDLKDVRKDVDRYVQAAVKELPAIKNAEQVK